MAKTSKASFNDEKKLVLVENEKGSLIQNYGFNDKGAHYISTVEALYLCCHNLLQIEKVDLSTESIRTSGIYNTLCRFDLLSNGFKCSLQEGDSKAVVFSKEKNKRTCKVESPFTCQLVSPDLNTFTFLEGVDAETFISVNIPQTCSYYKIKNVPLDADSLFP